jgi:hypothetical protein
MNYRIILDSAHNGELTRLFGATKDIAVFTASRLVDGHTGLSGATLMAQGADTGGSSSSSSSSDNGDHHGMVICTDHHPCPTAVVPHDPYLIAFGAGVAIGLVVGLVVGVLVGRSSKQAR